MPGTPVTALSLSDIDYALPEDRIAQVPLAERDASLMLEVTAGGTVVDRRFRELPGLLRPGDLLVANHTRVRAARLAGRRESGGAVEILVLSPQGGDTFECLVRPGRRLVAGERIRVGDDLVAVIGSSGEDSGHRSVRFESSGDVVAEIEARGQAPLPPYITARLGDASRYQTVYASGPPVSAAAPTAGLHFTEALRAELRTRGIGWAEVDLEVGLGTFSPIRRERIEEHRMHSERFTLPAETADAINATRRRGGRVIAVGTTTLRTLESCRDGDGRVQARSADTDLYITPGYRVDTVDALLTNFHQPRSSLVVLVAALLGVDMWRRAYDHALAGDYRFLSFGDCMLAWLPR